MNTTKASYTYSDKILNGICFEVLEYDHNRNRDTILHVSDLTSQMTLFMPAKDLRILIKLANAALEKMESP